MNIVFFKDCIVFYKDGLIDVEFFIDIYCIFDEIVGCVLVGVEGVVGGDDEIGDVVFVEWCVFGCVDVEVVGVDWFEFLLVLCYLVGFG